MIRESSQKFEEQQSLTEAERSTKETKTKEAKNNENTLFLQIVRENRVPGGFNSSQGKMQQYAHEM